MENSAHLQLPVGAPEQTTMSAAGTSATPGETSNFHTALEECLLSVHDIALGDRSGACPSMEQKSEYFSARVEEMMRSKSQFSSGVDHEIEHSRVHWSEVPGLSGLSEISEVNDYEDVNQENAEVFAELKNDPQWRKHVWGNFFLEWTPALKLGRKIAEGGQAAIFEVLDPDGSVNIDCLLKVFKRGSRLSNLRKQWPCGILQVVCVASFGTMLDDGRFAFGLKKCWGDLRKFIDQAMQEKNNQGPPFPYELDGQTLRARDMMWGIASRMDQLHKRGIIHRDLKAANILLHNDDERGVLIFVADFECSIGVIGSRFWRAPEILLALKNGSAIDFMEKMDVYSYGMTCFGVVTGRLPFEGELEDCRVSRDLVIAGQRPKLPSDLDVTLKNLIERCWNPIPNDRPSFVEILDVLSR